MMKISRRIWCQGGTKILQVAGSDFDFSSKDTPSLDYSGALNCDVTLVGPNDVAMRNTLEVCKKHVHMRRSGMNDIGQSE
mmetsp:Transcript_25837/g.39603  ORF Transcript_25837/g.39603 Transcript_25837/m.39603 type:complete len:80 (-) Transcript_25837:278-517(-)